MTDVLILEDELTSLQALSEILTTYSDDIRVHKASSLKEAKDLLDQEIRYGLFLLDVNLSGEDREDIGGILFAREIRERFEYTFTPIVMVTAIGNMEMQAYRELHCYQYIMKPFRREQVEEVVQKVLEKESREKPPVIVVKKDGINYQLKCEDIRYLEAIPRGTRLHLVTENWDVPYVTLRQMLLKMPKGMFAQCHRMYAVNKNEVEKVNKLYIKRGKELIEVDELCAGDIGCMTKLSHSSTNDTLCTLDYRMKYQSIHFSKPYYGKAIQPIGKANEEKIASGITRLLEEDQTLKFENNHETKQQCIYGIGDIHLESVVAKLKSKFKIDVKLSDMKVSYRETIRKSYTQRTKFKKQSGGHGQYGEVEILFEPTKDYSQSYIFKEKVFGGAVPKAYFPAVEKGLIESVKEGVIGHYPVLGIQATLLDGSYHSVDSSEQAFKTATMMCFKEAMKHLDPCLLEPYVILNIYIDEEYLGDLMSHVNKKRGKVLETDSLDDGLIKLVCRIPQVEILEFAIDLRSITQGQGLYDYYFDGYEIVNDDLVERLLKK